MKYLLSTIADVDFRAEEGKETICYTNRTAETAAQYDMGMELAEFCIAGNLDGKNDKAVSHFEYNRNACSNAVLHGPYNELYPHAIDRKVAQAAWERYDWTWKLCLKYGLKKIVLHANYVPSLYYPQWFVARQIEFWKDFLKAHPEDITICLENVMEPDPFLIKDIITGVDNERLKMCLDVGHANLTETEPLKWLDECSPYIYHYHIHNNNGPVAGGRASLGDTHSALDCGTIDMKAFLDRAEELTPNATAAVENFFIEESAHWLRKNGYI